MDERDWLIFHVLSEKRNIQVLIDKSISKRSSYSHKNAKNLSRRN